MIARCANCRTPLSAKEVQTREARCGKCRYNSHGAKAVKVEATAKPAFWLGAPPEGFTALAMKQTFKWDKGVILDHGGRLEK